MNFRTCFFKEEQEDDNPDDHVRRVKSFPVQILGIAFIASSRARRSRTEESRSHYRAVGWGGGGSAHMWRGEGVCDGWRREEF